MDKKTVEGQVPVRLCNYTDVYYNERISADLDFMDATATPEQRVAFHLALGDVLVTKDSETPDDIGVAAVVVSSTPDLVCGYHLALVRPKGDQVDGRYLRYTLASGPARGQMSSFANGITRFGLRATSIGNVVVPMLPIDKQWAIADYLDRETARLDSLIERKKRMAHLARERFAAQLESRTGSAGGPLVPIRRLVSAVTTGSRDWSDLVLDGDGYFIRATNLSRHSTVPDLAHEKLARLQPPRTAEAQRAMLQSGDVLVCVTGYPGSVAFWAGQVAPSFVSQHVAVLRPTAGTLGQWMAFALLAPSVQAQITARQYGGTKQGLGLDDLKELRVALASPTQQAIVAAELADAQANMGTVVAYCDRQVDLLREKRQALITAAVTEQVTMSGAG